MKTGINTAALCIKGVRAVSQTAQYKIRTTKFQSKLEWLKNRQAKNKNKTILAEKYTVLHLDSVYMETGTSGWLPEL